MADEGPTTVGSIDGKLTLNIEDWKAKVAVVKAQAHELGLLSPDIKVDVDSAGAITKMAEVDAAAEAMGASGDKAFRTIGAGASEGNSRVQWIVAGITALIALAAPLGAAAVAIGGGLAGMGAAGVLAVIGVVAAIKQGNDAGQEWSRGLQTLKGDLDHLSSTAAASVLDAFQQSVQLINAQMPELNGEVRLFAGSLGTVLVSGLRGVITAFQVLNPLFMQGVGVVERLAAGFESWTQSGGLQQFASYAQSELPTVVSTIGHLAEAVINVVVALAPLGSSILTVVDGVSGLLSWLSQLGPTLSIVTGAVLAGFAAFKLWGLIGPILATAITWMETTTGAATAMGVAIDGAMGPIGWVAAGVTALAAAVGIGAAAMNTGTTATTDYTAALTASNGAIDQNVRSLTAKALVDAGGVSAANQLGIATAQLTDAILNQNGARKDLITQLQDEVAAGTQTIGMGRSLHVVHDDQAKAAQKLLDIINPLASSFDSESAAVQATDTAAQSTTVTTQDLTSAMDAVTTAVDNAAQALQNLGSTNMSAAQAQIAYKQSVADATKTIEKNGATLNENTQKGRDNSTALLNMAKTAIAVVSAQAKQGASEKTLQGTMQQSRQDFIKAAMAAGDTRVAAEKLANQYVLIPKSVKTAFQDAGYQAAIDHAYAVKLALGQIPRQVLVHYGSSGEIGIAGPGGARIARAGGGTIHGPGSRTADRVAANLSDSEEVISNDRGQADRWRSMLKLINANAPAGEIAGRAMRMAGATSTAQPVAPVQTMPSTLVVVDADGALIGRMRVEAHSVSAQQSAGRTASLMAGRRS